MNNEIKTKEDLLSLSYPNENEKKLKLTLIKKIEELGFDKAHLILAFRNALLLSSCEIDENEFNYILLKNYIYYVNNSTKTSLDRFTRSDEEKLDRMQFDTLISINEFENALELCEESVFVYQILCYTYLETLPLTEVDKIKNLSDSKVSDIYNKISQLQDTNLISKKYKKKIYNI